MLTIVLAVGMTVVDGAVANIALPTIAHEVGATPAASIWVVNAYQLTLMISLLPLSSLGDSIGYRKVYQSGFRGLHHSFVLLCHVPFASFLSACPCSPGIRSRGYCKREHSAGSNHLSRQDARSRDGRELHGRCIFSGSRTDSCRRNTVDCFLAMAVRRECPCGNPGSGNLHAHLAPDDRVGTPV